MRFLALFILPLLLCANEELLSSLKQKSLELEYKRNSELSSKKSKEWINPINASYRYQNNDLYEPNQESMGFGVVFSQPIFKSGGIYYQLELGSITEKLLNNQTDIRKQGLLKETISTLYMLKKVDLQLQKQKFLIENARIDLLRKTEQYKAGFLDAGFLDNAMLAKNQDELKMLEIEDAKADLEAKFYTLSDANYNEVELPLFKEVSKEQFLSQNLELSGARYASLESKYNKNIVISSYLPKVSLEGTYSYEKVQGGGSFGVRMPGSWEDYRTYGVTVSMPLFDINIKNNIQSASIDYLKKSIEIEDKKREQEAIYKEVEATLRMIQKKIELSAEDIKSYDSLIKSTIEGVKAGDKTTYDLETLQNSKKIRELDIKIYNLDRELELLKLYEKMRDGEI